MYTYEQSAVRAEAKRYCHEHGITDSDLCGHIEEAIRHRMFMEATDPLRKQMARFYGFRYLKRVVLGATLEETEYEWIDPEAPKLIERLQDLINAEARKFGYRTAAEPGAAHE